MGDEDVHDGKADRSCLVIIAHGIQVSNDLNDQLGERSSN